MELDIASMEDHIYLGYIGDINISRDYDSVIHKWDLVGIV